MKKVIFGVFAHPDDEAFGPAGTILSETEAGNDVHLVTLTAGQAGTNPDDLPDLGEARLAEWRTGGTLMGAASFHYLGYEDGRLDNRSMIDIGTKLEDLVWTVLKDYPDEISVEFLTFELGGITGHIDHIVAARAVCQTYYRLKAVDRRISRLRLFCLPETLQKSHDVSWIFMDHGYGDAEISETVDVTRYRDRLVEIAKAHHTQRSDGEKHLARLSASDRLVDHFIVRD